MIAVSMLILAAITATCRATPNHAKHAEDQYYLPNEAASKVVTVTTEKSETAAAITILTQAIAIKETGPKQTARVCLISIARCTNPR